LKSQLIQLWLSLPPLFPVPLSTSDALELLTRMS